MAVTLLFGAHVGQQNMAMDDMRALWRWLDGNGFDWISAWDHIYEAPPAGGTLTHFEDVATLGAMAVETSNARLGCLVFYVGYRNPGLLAKAAITLDHLSGGRFELGLGGGWHRWEAAAYGYDFPAVGVRLDMLEEATELIGHLVGNPLVTGEGGPDGDDGQEGHRDGRDPVRTTFDGEHFRVAEASCLPTPVYGSLPLWIGGVGENRTMPLAARSADGWNAAYVSPEEFGRLNRHMTDLCEANGRDPASIERSVNLIFAMGADASAADRARAELFAQWGPMATRVEGGALTGETEQVSERIAAYADAGADMVNIALRAPFDAEALAAYVEVVMPALRTRY